LLKERLPFYIYVVDRLIKFVIEGVILLLLVLLLVEVPFFFEFPSKTLLFLFLKIGFIYKAK